VLPGPVVLVACSERARKRHPGLASEEVEVGLICVVKSGSGQAQRAFDISVSEADAGADRIGDRAVDDVFMGAERFSQLDRGQRAGAISQPSRGRLIGADELDAPDVAGEGVPEPRDQYPQSHRATDAGEATLAVDEFELSRGIPTGVPRPGFSRPQRERSADVRRRPLSASSSSWPVGEGDLVARARIAPAALAPEVPSAGCCAIRRPAHDADSAAPGQRPSLAWPGRRPVSLPPQPQPAGARDILQDRLRAASRRHHSSPPRWSQTVRTASPWPRRPRSALARQPAPQRRRGVSQRAAPCAAGAMRSDATYRPDLTRQARPATA